MKRFFLTILSFALISFNSAGQIAQIAIEPEDMPLIKKASVMNDDGDTIGYYFNIDEKTASVTYRGNNFYDNEYSDSIVIPKEVKYNGETYLVTKIGDNAFDGCSKLTNVSIPNSVTKIGRFSFRGCRKLTNVTIPDNVKEIAWRAFMACTNLTEVTIPANTATVGDEAFMKCSALKSIVVEKGSQNYCSENGILYDKSKTTLLKCPEGKEGELVIPNGVKKISHGALANCKITEVTIPNSLIEIGKYSFSGCELKSITCNCANPPAMYYKYESGFYGVDKNIPVYVPSKSVAKYKNSDDWKEFKNILPISDK